mgnify:CR=1 FL=1
MMEQPGMDNLFAQLEAVLRQRREQGGDQSYVASLYKSGLDRMLKKIGEEATEVVLAAKNGDAQELAAEMADLWFHCLVVLAYRDMDSSAVMRILAERFGRSGLEEKASRPHN